MRCSISFTILLTQHLITHYIAETWNTFTRTHIARVVHVINVPLVLQNQLVFPSFRSYYGEMPIGLVFQ